IRYKYKFEGQIYGKTGTTQNQSDGWFFGVTPELATGIWVGGEDRSIHFRGIRLGQGASMALPIWAIYMRKVYDDKKLKYSNETFFDKPEGLNIEFDCNKVIEEDAGALDLNYDLD
ncbi:MAG: penicillin-binding protein, partial [Ichthyobacteriaceae bacterium]|nr:penicillin-binding protein [Ichthyobacteriaceae bacterium]